VRFKKDSEEYGILRRWLASGMPNDLRSAAQLRD